MARNWLVTGASGLLGRHLCAYLYSQGENVSALYNQHNVDLPDIDSVQVDLGSSGAVSELVASMRPDIIIHAAGVTNVDECERNTSLAEQLHVNVTGLLAQAAARDGGKFVLISTDHLWDGSRSMVTEDDEVTPVNMYAATKARGETEALRLCQNALILRTNFFGPGRPWRLSFSDWLIKALSNDETVKAFRDVYFTPISLALLCPLIVEMVDVDAVGVYHVAGSERVSKFEFAMKLAKTLDLKQGLVMSSSVETAQLSARRPKDMSLSTVKAAEVLGRSLPSLSESLETLLVKS